MFVPTQPFYDIIQTKGHYNIAPENRTFRSVCGGSGRSMDEAPSCVQQALGTDTPRQFSRGNREWYNATGIFS